MTHPTAHHAHTRLCTALFIGTVLSTSTLGYAQPSAAASTAKAVIDAEHAYAAALGRCDSDELARLITDDFTFTDFNGMTYARHWFIGKPNACARSVARIEPMQVTLSDGDRTAVVLSRYHQFLKDAPEPVHHLTHLLVNQNGAWRVAHHHSTVMRSNLGPAGDQYGLPNGGKAFLQLQGGPSTKTAPAFEPTVVRSALGAGASPSSAPGSADKPAVDAALIYANLFQNCRTAELDRIMSPHYLITGFNGMTYTRRWMAHGSDDCYHDLQRIEPLQLRLYGNTALLLGRYHQFVSGKPADLRHLTMVLFREEGRWRIALHHSTTFNEKVGSQEGKLFYSEGGDSTLVTLPFPNSVVPRPPSP